MSETNLETMDLTLEDEIRDQFVESAAAQIKENPSENMRDYLDILKNMQEIVNQINFEELGGDRITQECIKDINSKNIVEIGKDDNENFVVSTLEMNRTANVHKLDFENVFDDLCDNIQSKLGNDASYKVACQYAETLVNNDSEYKDLARILP
jgi:hypothetical protein